MYYIVRAARKSSGEILHKPECTVSIETGGGMNPINFLKAHCAQQKIKNENPGRKTGNPGITQFPYDVLHWSATSGIRQLRPCMSRPKSLRRWIDSCYYWISPVFGPGFFCVICQIMRFETASVFGISLKTTCPDRFFFEISGRSG